MKYINWLAATLVFLLTACGQPGPLYLPKAQPPVYVPPETKDEPDSVQQEENPEKEKTVEPKQQ